MKELLMVTSTLPQQSATWYTQSRSVIQVSQLDDVLIFMVLQVRPHVVICFRYSLVPMRTILARRRAAFFSFSLAALVLAADDDIARDQECGSNPPERRQVLREDHKSEQSGDKEVGRSIHDGNLRRRVPPSQGLSEEGPHHSVENQVEPEKDLGLDVSLALLKWSMVLCPFDVKRFVRCMRTVAEWRSAVRLGPTYGADNVFHEALDRIEMEESSDALRKADGGVSRCPIR